MGIMGESVKRKQNHVGITGERVKRKITWEQLFHDKNWSEVSALSITKVSPLLHGSSLNYCYNLAQAKYLCWTVCIFMHTKNFFLSISYFLV